MCFWFFFFLVLLYNQLKQKLMPTPLIHCSVEHYHQMKFDDLGDFGLTVKSGFFSNNPPFIVQPITETVFGDSITDYTTKHAAYKSGGLLQKGPFLIAKDTLITNLDKIAVEVDKVALGNPDIITLSGNVPTDGSKSHAVKPGQAVVTIERGMPLEIVTKCALVHGAKHYGCILVQGGPLPNNVELLDSGKLVVNFNGVVPFPSNGIVVDLNDQREKHFPNLAHDVTYYAYYFCVNSAGVGPLSDPVSIVCW
jgi:hypothetical protein